MNNRGFAFLCSVLCAGSAAYGCSGSVIGSGSTATGTGGSPVNTTDGQGGGAGFSPVSGTSAVTGVGGGNSGSSGATGSGGALPGCQPKNGVILAVTKFYYGDTDFNDAPDKVNGWKQYGANIDGKISTAASLDLCKPMNNAPQKNVYPDGNNGIDNSFGKNVLPIFLGIAADFSTKANDAVAKGDYTIVLDLAGLGPSANQAPLASRIYEGTPLGAPPKLDGSDCWPVAPEGLTNPGDINSAKSSFPMGNVAANHWDSGPTSATLPITFGSETSGFQMHLILHHPRVFMDLDAGHLGTQDGQISGVLDTAEFVMELKTVAGMFDPSLCSGATIDSITSQLQQASDILKDGSQDPSKQCDGISIGIGFKAKAISLGGIGPATPAPPNPCAP
jgi:hypothetical protein